MHVLYPPSSLHIGILAIEGKYINLYKIIYKYKYKIIYKYLNIYVNIYKYI